MTDSNLIAQALSVRSNAYAPYSGYQVGAALLGENKMFTGANVENASYGATICAERSAVTQAISAGIRQIDVVAIATENSPPAAPCGICRQVLREFCDDPASLRVLLVNSKSEIKELTLADLLPRSFAGDQLDP